MKVYLDTIGCRLNQSEIEAYANQFRAAGHTLVSEPGLADMVVVNTCSVTVQAASDSRQKVRQAAHAGAGQIVLTGCWSTLEEAQALALPGVSRVIPNQNKDQLVAEVLNQPGEPFDQEPLARQPLPGLRLRTRAFIKVQDGCDNHCTFCITRLARGESRSRPAEDILADIHGALRGGAREIVLSGVQIGSWGADLSPRQFLFELIAAVLQVQAIQRLRLSSLEPWDLDEPFFDLWQDPRLCRHLHLPLQSGSAATLRRMARKVTPHSFMAIVEAARRAVPDLAFTTDIIAGFPGESEAEFQESLAFIRRVEFAGGHVFPYSGRPGTPAVRYANQVPHPVRRERSAEIRQVLAEASLSYRQRFVGRVMPVLWEASESYSPEGWRISGLTDNYLRVASLAQESMWNKISLVRLGKCSGEGMQGDILPGQQNIDQ